MKRKLQPKRIPLIFALLLCISAAWGQSVTVSGTVKSESNAPLQGVTVSVSKSNSTQTDAEGKFKIQVPDKNANLVFSSSGYILQTVNLNGRSDLYITLKQNVSELEEVVVTAFGIQRQKKSLGYVTQVVKGEDLAVARETNVANSLKGRVAGVYVAPSNGGPGGSTFIDIRGVSSFKGATKPLIVVDGIPVDNSTINPPDIFNAKGINRDYGDGIGNILPDDIENITVLKGPNGAALYGSRGAPGVILITTKKGSASKKIGVDFNTNATFEKPNVLPQYQSVWGGGYDDNYAMYGTTEVDGQEVSVFPSWLVDHWGGKYDGRKIQLEMWPEAGLIDYVASGEDNIRSFYRTGSTFTNSVGISGGTEKVNYRLSLSDLRNTGITPNSSLNRQTVNLRVGFNATDKLYFEGKVNYIANEGNGRPANGLDINTVQFSLNRIPSFITMDLLKNYKSADGRSNNWADGRPFNPYWVINEMPSHDTRDRWTGYVLGRYNFNSWLTLQARTGTDFYNDVRHSQINVGTPTSSLRNGQLMDQQITVREDNSDVLLTAAGNLSKDFTASASIGANHMNREFNMLQVEGYNMNIPGIYNIINAGLVYPLNQVSREQINSVFGIGQIGYKGYLYLDITGRNDWSSTLGEGNYGFFYPSVSTSFVFTDAFKMNSNILNYGKVRLSYAQAGKGGAPYQTQIGYSLLTSSYNGQQFGRIRSDVPEVNLKNELTSSFEFGTEMKFFNNRIGIDFTYYNSTTKNQILPLDISPATGFSTKITNAGEIRNRGFEVMLNLVPVASKDFNWDIFVNLSRNRSQVMSLAPGIDAISLITTGEVAIEARPGLPYGNIVGYGFKRAPDGQKWLSATGVYQHDDTLSVLGNMQPDFLSGITNTISYKGFTLSALVDMRIGGEIFSYSKAVQTYSGTAKYTENGDNLISDGVIQGPDGKFTKSDIVVGRMNYYTSMGWGNITEAFVLPADYVALREVSLGYTVGKFFKKSAILSGARFSVVGRNLFYIYRDPEFKTLGISPESAFNASTIAQGFEQPAAPTTRSVGFNLSFAF